MILPNGIEPRPEDIPTWEKYHYHCVKHPTRWGVTIHHEPPRSLGGTTGYVLCSTCHDHVHDITRKDAVVYLDISTD